MAPRIRFLSAAALTAAVITVAAAFPASAHEISNAGQYRLAVGWQFEPPSGTVTWVDEPNAVQLFIDQAGPGNGIGNPVSDLNSDCGHPDLQVTVTVGSTTSSAMCPELQFDADTGRGRQDEYDAALTPTAVGDYTFHIFGTIHGTKVDHTVKSGPNTFDSVGDQSSVQFPTAVLAPAAEATKVDQIGGRAGSALTTAQNAATQAGGASDSANRATVLSIVALVLAVLLGAVGLLAGRRRPKP